MTILISKLVALLQKNWKAIATAAGSIAAGIGGFFLGRNIEYHKSEKRIAELQEVIRKHEAAIMSLESVQKKNFKDRKELKKLKAEKIELEKELATLKQEHANA